MLKYVDDTLLFCNKTDTITVDVINKELSKICDWLGANKLSLNIVKKSICCITPLIKVLSTRS